MKHFPTTPFATPLSRSGKETELRIRSIFQWKKQRPPLWLMVLVAMTILGCCGLVSCQPAQLQGSSSGWLPGPEIAMAVRYYDDMERVVEVPELLLPEHWEGDAETIDALNALFSHLEEEHGDVLSDPLNEAGSHCIFYPTETERYLNLVFYREWLASSGNDGQITARVYDKEHQRLMDEEEALVLAGLELDDLLAGLEAHCQSWLDGSDYPADHHPVAYGSALEGFRVRADGQPEFYLSVHAGDDPSGPSRYGVWKHLYVFADGVYTHYNCRAAATDPAPLVPVIEVLDLEEPLWCQWYFQGGEGPEIKMISHRLQAQVEPEVTVDPAEVRFLPTPMEGLTGAQKDLLADLPSAELPREAADLSWLFSTDIWRDTLIPLAHDEARDVTLYGVVAADSIPHTEPLVALLPQELESDGVVLRVGNRAAYFPLIWQDNVWSSSNPWMEVKDFDFDGQDEAAVCLFSSHGTGVKIKNLFIFDLDTLTYSIPEYTVDIHVSYDPTAHTATLTSADQSATVDIPPELWNFRYVTCGQYITFSCENGRLYCHMELDFGGMLNYLCTATFPILLDDNGYYLGRVSQFQPYWH